jgi:hypothetical protein
LYRKTCQFFLPKRDFFKATAMALLVGG